MPEFSLIREGEDPFALFAQWLEAAKKGEPADPNAMILSTVGPEGFPRARAMLMKSHDERGFVFYTNQQSAKGDHLRFSPKVGLLFFWKSLYRQVHIEGVATPVAPSESDAYFASRPRESQIGAWTSQQSRPLESREAFETLLAAQTKRFEGQEVTRPPHWGGYRVAPLTIEFWSGHHHRLHDRVRYTRQTEGSPWSQQRLFP